MKVKLFIFCILLVSVGSHLLSLQGTAQATIEQTNAPLAESEVVEDDEAVYFLNAHRRHQSLSYLQHTYNCFYARPALPVLKRPPKFSV